MSDDVRLCIGCSKPYAICREERDKTLRWCCRECWHPSREQIRRWRKPEPS